MHTEHGLRRIGDLAAGDHVWSFRFGFGDWVLRTVAERRTSTYHGTLTRLRTAGGLIEATGDHSFWVVRGVALVARPRCLSLTPMEDEGGRLDGRWVAARDVQAGDVLYGRDGDQHAVLEVDSREGMGEVCTLAIEQHANFAVGADGVLVHNEKCWKDLITDVAQYAVPQALLNNPLARNLIHGHHIVLKTLPKNTKSSTYRWIKGAQQILTDTNVALLAARTDVRVLQAAAGGGKAPLYNLCYAANSFQGIHLEAYCKKVYELLAKAEASGATKADKTTAVQVALRKMADILEAGGKFW